MDTIHFDINNNPKNDDVNYIKNQLKKFNSQFAEDDNHTGLTVFLKEGNAIIGGLVGGTYWNWMYIDILWVDENYRGQGLGSKLLQLAEKEAIKRGCKSAHLDTHDFQGLEFYIGQNYKIMSELKDLPQGHSKYLLKKDL